MSTKQNFRTNKKKPESFFKIGISADYILIRDDFPISEIPPGEFKALIIKMFKRNDEALKYEK